MKTIELDLTGCEYAYDIHKRIQATFEFPEWYGKNWDAFWDLLWSECDADKVVIKGEKSLPKGLEKSINIMHEILERNKQERSNSDCPFDYEVLN